jgi:hypothetical protein
VIRITDKSPIRLERILKETVNETLNKLGFIFEDDFPSTPEEDSNVFYSKIYQGFYEGIGFIRKYYSDKYDKDCDDEAERVPHLEDENDKHRYSRHLLDVRLIFNRGHRYLLTTGKAGIARTEEEEYWYFEDEEDLRKLLAEKIIPLLQTTVMKDFDEQLENELEYLAKSPKVNIL